MTFWLRWLVCICLLMISGAEETPVIQTPLGPVKGRVEITDKGTEFYSFEGIPYAKPPVGDLRFKPPEPVSPWSDTLSATSNTIMCIQTLLGGLTGSEDCLYLNVFSPKKAVDNPLPVMMFIHGGGFKGGSGSRIFAGGPDFLVDKDVVVVTINYRLGPLGFLSSEDSFATGNYGILDQIAALKWIQQNIRAYGGDPDNVTIFGESAGGASVHLHVLSPLSKGLFHRAISQSGQMTCPWALNLRSKEVAKDLGRKLNCPISSSQQLIECLKDIDAAKIIENADADEKWHMLPIIWNPRVDSESPSPVLPKRPLELINQGDINPVPYLLGINKDEGLFVLPPSAFLNEEEKHRLYTEWTNICKFFLMDQQFDVTEEETISRCHQIRNYYIAGRNIKNLYHQEYTDMMTGMLMSSGWQKTMQLSTNYQPLYAYTFDFFTEKAGLIASFSPNKNNFFRGVNHADELMYLFKHSIPQINESPEVDMRDVMTTVWTSFAKTGIPVAPHSDVNWATSSAPGYEYMSLDLKPTLKSNYRSEEITFWEDIFKNTWYKSESIKDEL